MILMIFEDTITNSVASNIKELIDFINLSKLSKNTIDELYNTQSKVLEDAYEDGIIDKDLEIMEEENIGSSEYQISINRILISVIATMITDRNYDVPLITSQRPIYIKDTEMFSLFENAESLIGIAYYQLLLNLTAGDLPYNIRRCKNPNCSTMFYSRYRQQYCSKEECQKYRKNIKGYNYYHRQEKKTKKKESYQIIAFYFLFSNNFIQLYTVVLLLTLSNLCISHKVISLFFHLQ